MEEITETYTAEVKCLNCGWEGTIEPEKGKAVYEIECPNCKTKGLISKVEAFPGEVSPPLEM